MVFRQRLGDCVPHMFFANITIDMKVLGFVRTFTEEYLYNFAKPYQTAVVMGALSRITQFYHLVVHGPPPVQKPDTLGWKDPRDIWKRTYDYLFGPKPPAKEPSKTIYEQLVDSIQHHEPQNRTIYEDLVASIKHD